MTAATVLINIVRFRERTPNEQAINPAATNGWRGARTQQMSWHEQNASLERMFYNESDESVNGNGYNSFPPDLEQVVQLQKTSYAYIY